MIHQVHGDILLSKAQVIAHGIAANDPMNQGLALALHDQYPSMHKDFHHWCHLQRRKPGEAWMWGGANNVRVVNLITQEGGYGSKPSNAKVKYVSDSLKALVKMAKKEAFTSIALPKVATGVGGLDWDEVWPVIEQRMGELEIPVYVYAQYRAGEQAVEPGL